MKRVLAVLTVTFLGVAFLWYWLTPHKHPMVRRAERGDVQAMYEVGMAHLSVSGYGIIDPRSPSEAVLWLRRAAEKGHIGAMWTLAGIGIPDDEKVMWLKKGAELGSKACMIELWKGYVHGMYGLPIDSKRAEEWQKIVRAASEDELRRQGYVVAPSK